MAKLRWPSMPRVRRLQDDEEEEQDLPWEQSGSEPPHPIEEEDNESGGRNRGPNQPTKIRLDENGRTILKIYRGRFVISKAPHDISATMKAFLGGPYPTWRSIPKATKTLFFQKFQNQYSWPAERTEEVTSLWLEESKLGA